MAYVGCSKIKINVDFTVGMNLQGYAIEDQKIQKLGDLYSRAFVIADNKGSKKAQRIAIVVVDFWTCTEAVKRRAIEILIAKKYDLKDYYDETNIMICGTHTHSAPAGLSDYRLYNVSTGGFNQMMCDSYATAIADSIITAHRIATDARILLYKTKLDGVGKNRSMGAYVNNPQPERDFYGSEIDNEMQILVFRAVSGFELLGVLTWYPIHGTSIGQENTTIHGDNKGVAAHILENGGFDARWKVPVAAFANSNAGDVSGNVQYKSLPEATTKRAEELGRKQAEAVYQYLFSPDKVNAGQEVNPPVRSALTKVDMSAVRIAADKTGQAKTYRATLGLSMFAGSTEDSKPPVPADYLKEGYTVDNLSDPIAILIGSVIMAGGTKGDINIELEAIFIERYSRAHPSWPRWMIVTAYYAVMGTVGLTLRAGFGAVLEIVKRLHAPLDADRFAELSDDVIRGHHPKPIFMVASRITPNILPLQVFRIGSVTILGVPAEPTTMAGRRLRKAALETLTGSPIVGDQVQANLLTKLDTSQLEAQRKKILDQLKSLPRDADNFLRASLMSLLNKLDAQIQAGVKAQLPNATGETVIVSGYANAYSQYITTREEYNMQHYEGASTLFGPHTLDAYIQEFQKLLVSAGMAKK